MERTSGCRKWLILAGGFFVFFLQYGMIKSLGLLINDIIADLDVSTAFVGFCISMVSGVSLILCKYYVGREFVYKLSFVLEESEGKSKRKID